MPILDIGGGTQGSGSGFLRDTHGQAPDNVRAQGLAEIPEEIFEKYPPAQFTVAGQTLAFPVMRIRETGGNRIIERERPYRDGAKLDDTGSKAKRWILEAVFNNSLLEKDISAINNGEALYPTVLNSLIINFDEHETGDLLVPTVGVQRVRAEAYERVEAFDERDQAVVSFTFCEDNEDSVGFRSITAPSGAGNAKRLAASTELDAQSFGSWSEALLELETALLELEDLINAPGDLLLDIEAAALRIEGLARRAIRTFSEASRPGRNLFLDPANSRGPRKLTQAEDLAARARATARRARPQTTTVVFQTSTSIFRIAGIVGQDVGDLLAINPDVDPNFIPAQTPVKVLVTASFLNASSSAS